jgi:hypothetical protein
MIFSSLTMLLLFAEIQGDELEKSGRSLPIPEVLFIPTPDDIVARMLELAKV